MKINHPYKLFHRKQFEQTYIDSQQNIYGIENWNSWKQKQLLWEKYEDLYDEEIEVTMNNKIKFNYTPKPKQIVMKQEMQLYGNENVLVSTWIVKTK